MHDSPTDLSPRTLARITGILYLAIFVCAGFAEGYVRSGLIVPGNPATTSLNILSSDGLFRAGFAADLVAFLCDLAVTVLLYVLLRPAGRTLALTAAAFRLVAHPAIASVNLLNHFVVLPLLHGEGLAAAFTPEQLQALALLFLELHRTGYLVAGAFFGVHCVLLGVLVFRYRGLPGFLGVLLGIAGLGYLLESFGTFLLPANGAIFTSVVVVTAVLGEGVLALWLLVKGVRAPAPAN